MTDLSLTYEDGLRLSELYGDLAGYTYSLDHIVTASLLSIVTIGLLFGVLWLFGGVRLGSKIVDILDERWKGLHSRPAKEYIDGDQDCRYYVHMTRVETEESKLNQRMYEISKRKAETRNELVAAIVYIIGWVCVIVAAYYIGIYVETYLLNKDILTTQAQIDAILERYQ